MTDLRTTKRQKLSYPVTVMPGDTICVTYREGETDHVLVEAPITRTASYDEALIIEGEFEGRPALGGILLERS